MADERIITLFGRERGEGSVYVRSPDVPFFHVVAPRYEDWVEWTLPILEDHLKRNLKQSVRLRPVKNLSENARVPLPAHVIAEMTAA